MAETKPPFTRRTVARQDQQKPESFLEILHDAPTEAARILRPLITEGVRRGRAAEIENRETDEATNAAIFADLFSGGVVYIPGEGWRLYDTERGRWIRDPDRVMVRRLALLVGLLRRERVVFMDSPDKEALRFIKSSLSAWGVRALLELAASEPCLIADRTDFDKDLDAVLDAGGNCINLRTGEARKATPEDRFTHALGAVFDPAAACPLFDRFILEAMEGHAEDVAFLQRWTGYSFTGRTSEQKIKMDIGPGGNGKGTLSNLLARIGGTYAATCDSEILAPTRSRNPEYTLAELPGVRTLVVRETRQGANLDEGLVKTLTGQDEIQARKPYERPFTFRPQFKPTLETNHAPRIRGRDHAIWRRIIRVPWTYIVPPDKRDPDLPEKLAAEASGVLNWIVAGAGAWYQNGLGSTPRIEAAGIAYRAATDSLGDFLADFAQGEGLKAPSGELYKRYRAWGAEAGLGKLMSAASFKEAMEERGFTTKREASGVFLLGISLDHAASVGGPYISTNSLHARAYGDVSNIVGRPTQAPDEMDDLFGPYPSFPPGQPAPSSTPDPREVEEVQEMEQDPRINCHNCTAQGECGRLPAVGHRVCEKYEPDIRALAVEQGADGG